MDRLGPDLNSLLKKSSTFSLKSTLMIADQVSFTTVSNNDTNSTIIAMSSAVNKNRITALNVLYPSKYQT